MELSLTVFALLGGLVTEFFAYFLPSRFVNQMSYDYYK